MNDEQGPTDQDRPESLLPYEAWTEEAFRGVAVRALEFVAINGLPGDHHFYVTFRTDHPGAVLPQRLRAKYPDEMTIVLQHKFWDLAVNNAARHVSVGLSFGGVSSILVIPFDAITGFADPSVRWGLRFRPLMPDADGQGDAAAGSRTPPAISGRSRPPALREAASDRAAPDEAAAEAEAPAADPTPQVVSLDAFRKRKD